MPSTIATVLVLRGDTAAFERLRPYPAVAKYRSTDTSIQFTDLPKNLRVQTALCGGCRSRWSRHSAGRRWRSR